MRTQGLQSCDEVVGVFIVQDGLCHYEVNRPRILLAGAYGLIWAISLQNSVAERAQNQSQHEEIGWLAIDYEDGLHGAPAGLYAASHVKAAWRCVGVNHRQLSNPQYGSPSRNPGEDFLLAELSRGISRTIGDSKLKVAGITISHCRLSPGLNGCFVMQ